MSNSFPPRSSGRKDKESTLVLFFSCVCVLNRFTCVQLFATLWTVAFRGPLSMEFSRQEYWSELLFPSPEHLPEPGTEPDSPVTPPLAGRILIFTTEPSGKLLHICHQSREQILLSPPLKHVQNVITLTTSILHTPLGQHHLTYMIVLQ